MNDYGYVTLVSVELIGNRTKQYLFYAPGFTSLDKNQLVLVDTVNGRKLALVQSACTVPTGSDNHNMILSLFEVNDVSDVKRIIGRYTYYPFDYKEENADESN